MIDHFATLGLEARTATYETCRKAYHHAARGVHPDRFAKGDTQGRAVAERRIREINAAWEILKVEDRRELHRKRLLERSAPIRPGRRQPSRPIVEDSEIFGPHCRGAMEAILIKTLRAERRRARNDKLKAAAVFNVSRLRQKTTIPELHIPDGMLYSPNAIRVQFPSSMRPGRNILALPGLKWIPETNDLAFCGLDCSTHEIIVGQSGPTGTYGITAQARGWARGPNIIFNFEDSEAPATARLASETGVRRAA